jgi:hypothetical protein
LNWRLERHQIDGVGAGRMATVIRRHSGATIALPATPAEFFYITGVDFFYCRLMLLT